MDPIPSEMLVLATVTAAVRAARRFSAVSDAVARLVAEDLNEISLRRPVYRSRRNAWRRRGRISRQLPGGRRRWRR